MKTEKKLSKIRSLMESEDRVAIAFTGGLASSFLLRLAQQSPKIKAIAVTVDSPFLSSQAYDEAKRVSRELRAVHRHASMAQGIVERVSHNSKFRYYQYMWEVLALVRREAGRAGFGCMVTGSLDGRDPDSLGRLKAGEDFGTMNPLFEAKVTREDLPVLAKSVGLHTESAPPTTFLPSLIPYGVPISPDLLSRIDRAERIMSEHGLHNSSVFLSSQDELVLRAHHSDIQFLLGNKVGIKKQMSSLFPSLKVECGGHSSIL